MFGNRFFAARYFGDRFFGQGGDQVAPPVEVDDGSAAAEWWWQQQNLQRYYEQVNRPVHGHAPGAVIEIEAELIPGRATGSARSAAQAVQARASIRAGKADANETCGGRAVVALVAIQQPRCFGDADAPGRVVTVCSEIVSGGASTVGACTGAALLAVADIRTGRVVIVEEETLAA